MQPITHYGDLDKRLEAGPPVDALCQKCRKLQLLDLFSGPRYNDYLDGLCDWALDVHSGMISEFSKSAAECRFCYLVITFHDAKHTGLNNDGGLECSGESEQCFLKPFRADAALYLADIFSR